jgi:hypothetical protein
VLTTTVALVKQTLIAQLNARPALAGISVTYYPTQATPLDQIYLSRHVDGQPVVIASFSGGQPTTRDESYTLHMTFKSGRRSSDAQAVEARVVALYAELETMLAVDPQMGLLEITEAIPSMMSLDTAPTDGTTVIATLEASIEVRARLEPS